ncbi:unnamed protein product [Moneuplotes crassus]|uniref:Uncharacterized protein n=1 Tax=Euplotes crassus TaxID=5936 RepID=A0AAD1XF97_EUPCR|nr:unnamed protein product [Moneuplotes crassus]
MKYLLRNLEFSNIQVNYLELINIQGNGLSECEIYNSSFINMTTKLELFKIAGCQNPIMHNNVFTNIEMLQNGLVHFETINGGIFNSTTLNNVHLLGVGRANLITFINSGQGKLQINDFNFLEGSIHNLKTLLSFSNPYGETLLNSMSIINVSSSLSSSYIKLLSVKTSTFNSLLFKNASTASDSNTSNCLLDLREMSSPLDTNTTFNSVTVVGCKSKVISIHNSEQLVTIFNQYITFNDLVIRDLDYPNPGYLIQNGQIFSDGIFKVVYNRMIVENIYFGRIVDMIGFAQKVDQFFEIRNSIFRNISNSAIDVKAPQKGTGIRTRVKFDNVTIEDWYLNYMSLIGIQTSADLYVNNCKFVRVTTVYDTALIWGYSSNTEVIVADTLITQNSAMVAVLFHLPKPVSVQCIRCNITNNFAVSNGVAFLDVGASIQFFDSEITDNRAYTIPVMDLSLAEKKSIFNNCRISNNSVLSKEYIRNTLMKESRFHPEFVWRIKSRDWYFSADEIFEAVVVSLMGEIDIVNGTIFSQQAVAVRAVDSFVKMEDVKIIDIQTQKDFIVSVQGSIGMANVTVRNFTSTVSSDILNALDSEVKMDGIHYEKSQGQFMKSFFCKLTINNFKAQEISNISYLFRVISSSDITIKNSTFKSISSSRSLLNIYKSDIQLLEDIQISNISNSAMDFSSSEAELFNNITITNCSYAFLVRDSFIKDWRNSIFNQCGNINIEEGGALHVVRSNITLQGSLFTQNKAKSGAAVAINCDLNSQCINKLSNNIFDSNAASVQGAGVYYNMNRPVIEGLQFFNNSAPYGKNIASYAFNILFMGTNENRISIDSVGSAISTGESYGVRIVDYDNQTMNLIDTSSIKIRPEISDSSIYVGGIDNARIVNGVANLTNFDFVATPGSQKVIYNVVSGHIDYNKINSLSNSVVNPLRTVERSGFVVDFRYCKPGEYETEAGQCRECSIKTYSLKWNSTSCKPCMSNAVCLGKDQVEINPGYWRKNKESSHAVQCLRERSCLGGFSPDNEHPINCEKGYEGFLCSKCSILDGEKYQPSSNHECLKCPSKLVNAIEFIGFQIVSLGFIYFIIILNIRKKSENQFSILMRIFTNYTQLIAAILSFNIKFPNLFESISSQTGKVSSPERTFFSFDCFIENNEIRMFAPSNGLFKLTLYLFLPIFLLIIVSAGILLYRMVMQFWKPQKQHDLKRYIAISFICIVFIFHPAMTFQSLKVFQCALVDDGDSRMIMHMDYKCFSEDHLKWIFFVGMPILIIWVIGMPFIAFIILFKKRDSLDNLQQQKYLLILYQGLKKDAFYWELVNTFRKFLVLLFNVFLSTYDPYYRILGAIVSLVILIRVQERLKPYKKDSNNRIEMIAIFASIVTLYCTIVYVTSENRLNSVYYGSLFLLFVVNAFFLVNWAYLVLCYLDFKHPCFVAFMRMYSFALCKNGSQFKPEIEEKRLLTFQSKNSRKIKKKRVKRRSMAKKCKKNKVPRICKKRFPHKASTKFVRWINPNMESMDENIKIMGTPSHPNESNVSRVHETTVVMAKPSLLNIAKDPRGFRRSIISCMSERSDES